MAFAGVSPIADGKLCASTMSAVDAGTNSGYHLLAVKGYSRMKEATPGGEFILSRPFIVGGHCWGLRFYPNGYLKDDEEIMSIVLVPGDYLGQFVEAHFAFSFIDQPELRVPKLICQSKPFIFYDCCEPVGQPRRFISKQVLERSRHLKNGSFIIRCDVVVHESHVKNEEQVADTISPPFIKLPLSDLQSHFSDLLLSREGADVTFEVGGEFFAAHRCILAARSTVFKAQLYGSMNKDATTSSVIKISGMRANVFRGLLTFIYTPNPDSEFEKRKADETEEEKIENHGTRLLQLYEAAERYDLQGMKSICEEKLSSMLADVIVVAERRQCRWLKGACTEYVKTHTSLHTVFTDDGLEQIIRTCSTSFVRELLSKFTS